jgi:hypothetical protein
MRSATALNGAPDVIFQHRRILFLLLILLYNEARTQTRIPCNEITGEMGFTVQSIRILGRWLPESLQNRVEQEVGLGQAFDPPRLTSAIELVRDELTKGERTFAVKLTGSTSVLYIDAQVCDVSDTQHPRQAQVTIRAYYLRIDLYNIGRNILPVPRSSRPTFFSEVPKALLFTSPVFSLTNDRQYGQALTIQTTSDLLQMFRRKNNTAGKAGRLNVDVDARKSINNPFHSIGLNLDYTRPNYTDTSIGWNLGVRYAEEREPLGNGRYFLDLFRIYGSIQVNTKSSFIRKYAIGAGARFLQNEYVNETRTEVKNPEKGYEIFTLTDGRIGKGFSRIGVWFDAGIPGKINTLKSYQRAAGRLAYGVTIGSGHNNLDLEIIAGAGHTWGTPPAYNRYFAGNASANFLYQPLRYVNNQVHPDGPIVRSLGEREGGYRNLAGAVTGGTKYWHLNLNISIPISKWAKPLIPDIVISEEPRVMTLRSALKGQSASAKNFILDDLVTNHGFPDNEETEAVAERIVNKDIRPTLDYLADKANIYSIKPLLLFDVAQINLAENKTWIGAGIGVQVTLVVARLDLGYMQTLSPSDDSGKGNLFLRFTLQNFY